MNIADQYVNKFKVIKYDIVNKNDNGYWVAEKIETVELIVELEEVTPATICRALKKDRYLESANMKFLKVSDVDSDLIGVYDKKTGKPLYRLERLSF